MKKILRIGEFSQINQISIQTLRFYDQIGLLKPYKVDPETNYRYYHINQSSLVDSIQYLRQLNFSLEDIKEILSDKDHFQLHQLIEERYQRLLEEKKNLEKQIQEIEIFRSGARIYGEKQSEQELEILTFPERQLLTFEIDQNIYQMKSEEYETCSPLLQARNPALQSFFHPFQSCWFHYETRRFPKRKMDFQTTLSLPSYSQ